MRSFSRLLPIIALALPASLMAQGTLSTQGFGYPSGQLSTRALGAGGSLGEIDPLSVSNPATLANFFGSALYFQAEPEYRTLTVKNGTERTTVARYPLVNAAIPIRSDITLGLSASNLLDRSFVTTSRRTQTVRDTAISSSNTFSSDGAIGDVRVALAWAPNAWFRAGIAAHAITGDNRLNSTQVFDDSTRYARLVDTATVGYTGSAYSAGVQLIRDRVGTVAASYRRGGPLSIKRGDTAVSVGSGAHVPDRVAFSAAYLGIRGSSLAFRTAKESWTNMRGLGSSSLLITDAWDTSVGADFLGPRLGERNINLRAGARWRTLPFGVGGIAVKENSLSFGLGTLLARGRAAVDLAGIHSDRDGKALGSESAWTMSVGLTVRP